MRRAISTCYLLAFTVLATFAQSRIDSVALRAMQVGRVMQQERVYLHFDNTAYYLGETIWFKAYTTFGTDDRPSTLSKVLYVELVAPEGYIVKTKKYKLDEKGSCHGEFELNPLYLSGYYEIRAYTRYMLNWGKDAVFSRVFPVFDKVNADNWDFKNMLDRRRGFSEKGEWVSAELPEATLDFFPESGHLVAGIESKVAYELRENDGLFSEEKITIFENNAPLLETVPSHMGKGSFAFTPKKGAKYRAEAVIKNKNGKSKKQTFKLPEIAEEGVVMSVAENGDSIVVDIRSCFADVQKLGFVILHRGIMGYYRKFSTEEGVNRFTFAKDSLREGVNRAVIFSDSVTPLAERQFFIMHDDLQPADNRTVKLNVTANGYYLQNATLSPYEKVTIKVSREDGKPITAESDLSVAVNDAAGKQSTSYSHNLYTYMLLGSEIKGYIPDAAQYFDSGNSKRKEQLDLIMLTHGWTSYDWSKLTRTSIGEFQPIERGITIKGRFFLKTKMLNAGNYGKIRIIPQKDVLTRFDIATDGRNITTSTFRTDSTGSFVLETDDFYGTRVASLKPQTAMKQRRNITYQFALDRYYSPEFRLYDYWERNLGKPMSRNYSESLVKMKPFEYMLSSLEVVADRKKEHNSRPPHSEMRFNYLDEWEYAQDVTYLNMFNTFEDEIFRNMKERSEYYRRTVEGIETTDEISIEQYKDIYYMLKGENLISKDTHLIFEGPYAIENINKLKYIINMLKRWYCEDNDINEDIISMTTYSNIPKAERYIGNIRYGGKATAVPVKHDYDHILTANDVVLSAMRRHNYNWAYWVQLMVVLGEYSHEKAPVPDIEYLRGIPYADKMTDFKEIVIRSDEKTRSQFENRDTHWAAFTSMLNNKIPVQKFYRGFLSQSYLFDSDRADGCPDADTFIDRINGNQNEGISYPLNPNYVACLIPYTEEEKANGLVPEYAATGSTMRYTSVQGYSESKQFYSPDYSSMKPQEKDYRRTLCWIPEMNIVDGEAVLEFYNSSSCSNISVDVTGRDNDIIFSNDGITRTRFEERSTKPEKIETVNKQQVETTPMDSATLDACAYHYQKGLIYYNQKRYKDAITIFAELVQYKYAPAMHYVAMCYRDGKGLKVNNRLAMKFFTEAAKNGSAPAQYELGMIMHEGTIAERDTAGGHAWIRRASLQSEPRAMVEMARRYREGYIVEADINECDSLLSEAAKQKEPTALYTYGMRLIEKGEDGIGQIKEAAELKHEEAMLFMFGHEEKAGNYKEAYSYAKELSALGNHNGTKRMADYYYEGKGVGRDKRLAKDLYREAAAAGNEEAKEILKRL